MKEDIGKLYILSTPIGNLEDITLRALKVLKEVDLVAAEDTRRTKKLLTHYEIAKPITSYYSYNEKVKTEYLIKKIESGLSIALVSDAGTPGISDPAYCIINTAIEKNIKIIPIPGASAVISALTVSGCKTDRFIFEGFLPRKSGKRAKRLACYKDEKSTFVIYESPHRIKKTLQEIQTILGDRKVALAREMTKMYEEIIRGRVSEVFAEIDTRKKLGEITLVIEGNDNG